MEIEQVDTKGKKTKEIKLNPDIFGVEPNQKLIAQAVRVKQARKTLGTKKTKARGEVSGGGRKPWRQKGTGRARHGSIRSPLWVGGGHTHAIRPTGKKRTRLSKKMRTLALASALSWHQANNAIYSLDKFELEQPKTKKVVEVLAALSITDKKILMVTPDKNQALEASVNNLPDVGVLEARLLNAYDVIAAEAILFVGDSLNVLESKVVKDGK